MFITDCLAYTDISAEPSRQDEVFTVTVRTNHHSDICLTLNYMQVKVFAEGLLALIGQAKLSQLSEASTKHPAGDIKLSFYNIESHDETCNHEEGEETCRPHPLSARTELKSRFKTA